MRIKFKFFLDNSECLSRQALRNHKTKLLVIPFIAKKNSSSDVYELETTIFIYLKDEFHI